VTTGTADGRLGWAHTGRSRRVEREVNGVTASVAHRDFNEARISSGEARSEAGHGGVPTAALRPELENDGSVAAYEGSELALGGAIGG